MNRPVTSSTAPEPRGGTVRFSTRNWILLGLGLLSVVGGYLLLGGGSTVAAPLLLVLGFVVLIPLGIVL